MMNTQLDFDSDQFREQILNWERINLSHGCYSGADLAGFPYCQGEYIPINARYSAMLDHRSAEKISNQSKNISITASR